MVRGPALSNQFRASLLILQTCRRGHGRDGCRRA